MQGCIPNHQIAAFDVEVQGADLEVEDCWIGECCVADQIRAVGSGGKEERRAGYGESLELIQRY